jgi:hypothetical protein
VDITGGGRGNGSSGIFTIAIHPNAPKPPENLRATTGYREVLLSWNAVSDADSYRIYRSNRSGSGYAIIGFTTTISFTNTGLTGNRTYYYTVTAVKGGLESAMSSEASATLVDDSDGGGGGSGGRNTALIYTVVSTIAFATVILTLLAIMLIRRMVARKAVPDIPNQSRRKPPGRQKTTLPSNDFSKKTGNGGSRFNRPKTEM